jgi:thiol-disulfide isomerase/thioredoxin
MKNIQTVILLFVLPVFGPGISAQHPFILKGNAPATLNGKKIILIIQDDYSANKFKNKDVTIVKNGTFSFSDTILNPCEKAMIMTETPGNFFYFVIEGGETLITVKTLPKGWPLYRNKLSNSEIKNSIANDLSQQTTKLINHYFQTFARPTPEEKRILDLDADKKEELWNKELDLVRQAEAMHYSLIRLYELLNQRRSGIHLVKDALSKLPDHLQESKLGKELNTKIEAIQSIMAGSPVPHFTIETDKGSFFSDTLLMGKPYLIVFGATWCVPCKEKYPFLKTLYNRYHDQGFEIVSVNLDEKKETWLQQIKTYHLSWIQISELKKWEESEMIRLFSIRYIPFYLLVDKKGMILYNPEELQDPENKKLEPYIINALK